MYWSKGKRVDKVALQCQPLCLGNGEELCMAGDGRQEGLCAWRVMGKKEGLGAWRVTWEGWDSVHVK